LPASCLFLAWLILWPWRRLWHVPPKWLTFTRLHSAICQKTDFRLVFIQSMLLKYMRCDYKIMGLRAVFSLWLHSSAPAPLLFTGFSPCDFYLFPKWKVYWKELIFRLLMRWNLKWRTCWRGCQLMTCSTALNNGKFICSGV
jgi:hypothetical protein